MKPVLFLLFALCFPVAASLAAPLGDIATVRLIAGPPVAGSSGAGSSGAGGGQPLGLRLVLAPGWKTYWRSPGDGGIPPRFDWSGSQNIADVTVGWPAPHRFSSFGMSTLGYDTQVVFPLTVKRRDPSQPAELVLAFDYAVCKQICVPRSARLTQVLPATPASPRAGALIARFAARVPGPPDGRLTITSARWRQEAAGAVLVVRAADAAGFAAPDVMLEAGSAYGFGAPRVTLGPARRVAVFQVPVWREKGALPLTGQPVRATLVDGNGHAIEMALTVTDDAQQERPTP
jgi:suppressor for copper-sensitivity B